MADTGWQVTTGVFGCSDIWNVLASADRFLWQSLLQSQIGKWPQTTTEYPLMYEDPFGATGGVSHLVPIQVHLTSVRSRGPEYTRTAAVVTCSTILNCLTMMTISITTMMILIMIRITKKYFVSPAPTTFNIVFSRTLTEVTRRTLI